MNQVKRFMTDDGWKPLTWVPYGLAVLLAVVPLVSHAQPPGAEHSEQLRQILELEEYIEELRRERALEREELDVAVDEEEETEFGEQVLLRRKEPHRPVSAFSSILVQQTNNALLTHTNETSDQFFVSTIGARYQPEPFDQFTFSTMVRQQNFRYSDNRFLDFDSLNFTASLSFLPFPDRGPTRVFGTWMIQQLTHRDRGITERGDDLLTNHITTLGVRHPLRLTRHQYLFLEVAGQYEHTLDAGEFADRGEPGDTRKDTIGFTGTYFYDYSQLINLNAGYNLRVAFYDHIEFEGTSRQDRTHILRGGLGFQPFDWWESNVTVSYTHNDSNAEVFEYDSLNMGISTRVNLRF